MKVLIDTNVALDILLKRQDFLNANIVYSLAEENQISGFISASAITDIFFLSKSDLSKKPAKEALKTLLQVFKPATVTDSHIYQALDLDWSDFEDSVQFVVGDGLAVDYIVTRNTHDFSSSSIRSKLRCEIPAVTPEGFIKLITDSK